MTDTKPVIKVPSLVELAKKKAAANNKAEQKKAKKKSSLEIIAVLVVVLVIIIALVVLFAMPKYKYSFNINGVDFVSNEYTPSEFFSGFKDSNKFMIVVDLKDGQSNAWVVNAMNLWIVALNADHKQVQTLVQIVGASNNIVKCSTNDGNILANSDINASACVELFTNTAKSKIVISLGSENKAVLSKNTIYIESKDQSTISQVNYFVIKQMYSDFDKTLAIVNERINAIK